MSNPPYLELLSQLVWVSTGQAKPDEITRSVEDVYAVMEWVGTQGVNLNDWPGRNDPQKENA